MERTNHGEGNWPRENFESDGRFLKKGASSLVHDVNVLPFRQGVVDIPALPGADALPSHLAPLGLTESTKLDQNPTIRLLIIVIC